MKKLVSILLTITIAALPLFAACSAPAPTATPAPAPTATPSPVPTPTPTPELTPTAAPTLEPTAEPTEAPTPTPTAKPTASPKPTVDPNAPPVLKLYFRSTRKLATGYDGNLIKGEKNAEFFALPTDKANVEKVAPRSLVEKYWGKYRKDGYRIGYAVDITLKSGEVIHLNIRRPGDAPPIQHEPKYFSKFVEIYMYDSARKDPDGDYGSWHLQERLLKKGEKVLITNIKFHAGSRYSEVASIDLTAYAYKGEKQFDEDGEYTGSLKYHIKISKK